MLPPLRRWASGRSSFLTERVSMIVLVDGSAFIVQDYFHNSDGACFKADHCFSAYRPRPL